MYYEVMIIVTLILRRKATNWVTGACPSGYGPTAPQRGGRLQRPKIDNSYSSCCLKYAVFESALAFPFSIRKGLPAIGEARPTTSAQFGGSVSRRKMTLPRHIGAVWALCKVQGSRFRVQGSRFRAESSS